MSVTTEQLERSISQLPVEEMLILHEHLIGRIHQMVEATGLDLEFRADIARRVKGIDAGEAQGVDAFRAIKQM